MTSGLAGLFAVRENWLFEPQKLGIHSCPPLAIIKMIYESQWLFEDQILEVKNGRVQKTRLLAICL